MTKKRKKSVIKFRAICDDCGGLFIFTAKEGRLPKLKCSKCIKRKP